MVDIKFKRLEPKAVIPSYETPGSAGADLYSVELLTILPGEVKLVPLGFAVEIPPGYEIQIRSRSGLALKKKVMVLNSPGTVDSDYRGPMMVLLTNFGKEPFVINPGDRIGQMVVNKVETARFNEVLKLEESHRGEGGFGSTGVN